MTYCLCTVNKAEAKELLHTESQLQYHLAYFSHLYCSNLTLLLVAPGGPHLRIFLAGWLNQVRTLFCQSLWK